MPFVPDSEEQVTRYSRHILLPEVGGKGQKKIGQARVLVIGAGGLGSPVALYLAAAGVGTIGIIDSDVVDLSNLQRQVIHHTDDVGRPTIDLRATRPRHHAKAADVIAAFHDRHIGAHCARVGNGRRGNGEPIGLAIELDRRRAPPVASSGLMAVCSRSFPDKAPAIVACSNSRRLPAWSRVARKPASSVHWPV